MVSEGTMEEIEESIDAGLAWLVAQQDDEGYWGPYTAYWVPYTGFALIKLQDRAYELGYDSPFDPEYGYASNVIAGWDFVFSTNSAGLPYHLFTQTLTVQDHTSGASGTLDDPDTNGNGYGIYFNSYEHYHTYSTGVMLMALEASGTQIDRRGLISTGMGSKRRSSTSLKMLLIGLLLLKAMLDMTKVVGSTRQRLLVRLSLIKLEDTLIPITLMEGMLFLVLLLPKGSDVLYLPG